jgi:hypothetical protein
MTKGRIFAIAMYWIGAVLDLVSAVALVVPGFGAALLGIGVDLYTPVVRYVALMATALMLGWTALLVWGAADPIARRGVLLLTVAPPLAGLIIATVYSAASGLVTVGAMIPMLVFQTMLVALFAAAWLVARRQASSLFTNA